MLPSLLVLYVPSVLELELEVPDPEVLFCACTGYANASADNRVSVTIVEFFFITYSFLFRV